MFSELKKSLHRRLTGIASWFADDATVANQSAQNGGAAPPANPPLGQIHLPPPFEGSAYVATVLQNSKPIMKVTTKVIGRLGKDGVTPQTIEEIRLTQQGKAISRTEFLTMDGLNVIGKPEQLGGLCGTCGRFTFQGQPCQGCHVFLCPACSEPLDETPDSPVYCPTCHRQAVWSRDNWSQGMV